MIGTVFLLMAEHNQADIPLETIAAKYFCHDKEKMQRFARQQKYPFPVFRGGSQKSGWLVNVSDLANWIDDAREEATKQHLALKAVGA